MPFDRKKPLPSQRVQRNAKQLRRDMTFPERLLWGRLRAGQVFGLKFRRQAAVDRFVVDFYCASRRLVIEIDGESHTGRADDDAERTRELESLDLRVIRLTNDEVIESLDAVVESIARAAGLLD